MKASEALPFPALLSLAWVAFTIEGDNLFEARMPHSTTRFAGRRAGPWLVSQAMWWTCMRFVDEVGIPVEALERAARTKTNLNGMIRWGYVTAAGPAPLKKTTLIRATAKGLAAREVWRTLTDEVEARWRARIGEDAMRALENALARLVAMLDPNLPDCMPILGYGLCCAAPIAAPGRSVQARLSLPEMLARTLLSFTLEYERAAQMSLAIAVNVLRLVDEQGRRLRDLPAASGVSTEAIAMAVGFLERTGLAYVTLEGRARQVTLTPAGLQARGAHAGLLGQIEAQWRSRFGDDVVVGLIAALQASVTGPRGEALLAAATAPPASGWRAAAQTSGILPWQPMVLHRGGFPDGA